MDRNDGILKKKQGKKEVIIPMISIPPKGTNFPRTPTQNLKNSQEDARRRWFSSKDVKVPNQDVLADLF